MNMLFYVTLCLILTYVQSQTNLPVVNTTQGWVQGVVADDGEYYAFYGVHYGGDTSGANRFKAPTPPPTYTDTYEAVEKDILCAQPSSAGLIGNEDCLRLSIFTKNVTSTENKPVLVWLIGEDYSTSNPLEHSFRRLVEEDLVIVAVNYRLSVFGFLCLGIEEAPGNAGLRDAMQALQWIQRNIVGFGGNPQNVVLFGHSSGAAMVDLITLSNASEGLVHKAIAFSGSALAPWALTMDPVTRAKEFGAELGFTGDSKEELANLLLTTSANNLVTALNAFELSFTNSVPFAPCRENVDLNPSNTFLAEAPYTLLNSGNFNHIPYIYGYVSKEGSIRADHALNRQWLQKMDSNFEDFIPIDLNLDEDQIREVREFYFGNANVNMNTIEEYFLYQGDSLIVRPLIWGVVERKAKTGANAWLLDFRYRSVNNSGWNLTEIPMSGVPHGGILNFLLDIGLENSDRWTMDGIVERIVTFCNVGDPNVNGSVTWNAVSPIFYYIVYTGGLGATQEEGLWIWGSNMAVNPIPNTRSLWDPLYEKYYNVPPPFTSSGSKVGIITMLIFMCQILLAYFNFN